MPPDAMDPTLPKAPLELGSTFAGYTIRALIGRGGHACVYRAYDEFLDKHFALKVLYRAGGVTPEMMKRGRAEAQFLSSFRHPHVVEVGRAGIENGFMYIQMELLEGRSLRLIQELAGRLEVEEVLLIAQQIAEGVAVAHQHKAIHRDLKPDNVFICTGNLSKVLDFGIAKLVGQGGWTTQRNLVVGTMLYMSPEQVQGMPVGAESDVYALALIMFTLLFGRHPCLLDMESVSNAELARIQVMRVPPQLDEIAPHIPIYVARLVAKALVKLPEERIRSMSDFAAMIRSVRERYIAELRQAGKAPQSRDLSSCDFNRDFQVSVAGRRAPFSTSSDTIEVSRPPFSQPLGLGEGGGTLPLPGGSAPAVARPPYAAAASTAEYGSPPSRSAPSNAPSVKGRGDRAPTSADKLTLMAVEGPGGQLASPPQESQPAPIPVRSVVFESPKKSRATPTPSPTSLGRTGSPVGAPIASTRRFQERLGPYRRALSTAIVVGAGLGIGLAVVHAVRRGSTGDSTASPSTLVVERLPDPPAAAAPPPSAISADVAPSVTPVPSPSAVVAELPQASAAVVAEAAPKPAVVARPAVAKSTKPDPVLESMKATAQRFREEAARAHQAGAPPATSSARRTPAATTAKSRLPFPDSGL